VSDPRARARFETAWGTKLDPNPGLTVTEITTGALQGHIKGMYVMGENPFLSDPNVNKVRTALMSLDFLAVQDIFLTETAEFADVILPAASFPEKEGTYTSTDRRVQLGRKAIDPPGEARPDWEVIADIANRVGYPMTYGSAREVFSEITDLSPRMGGLAYDRLGKTGILWPCPTPGHPGTSVLFTDSFPRGKGKFVPVEFASARELPDEEYPLVLNTGRTLEHWHTGTMTRRSRALHMIRPEPYVEMNHEDMAKLGLDDQDWVRVSSRRGSIELKACRDNRVASGSVFIAFHFREAAANLLTIDEVDPWGKTPEYKICAVRVERLEQ
jgi:formate dehydrogenase major subunit